MLAFYLSNSGVDPAVAQRLGASLGLFAPRSVEVDRGDRSVLARTCAGGQMPRRGWKAPRSAAGTAALFTGWFDNKAEVARELGCDPRDPALVYACAVDLWGADADSRIVGHYASVCELADGTLRLARSPYRAPPLHYAEVQQGFAAASVVRVLHAAGASTRLAPRKLADALFLNMTEDDGWYEGTGRVALGQIVVRSPDGGLRKHRWHDPLDVRPIAPASDVEYLAEAERLLGEAVAAALEGSRQPGAFLSGGLDSSNVAARALRRLPGRRLPCFTFVPGADWDWIETPAMVGDERAAVEAFARFNPGIEATFVDSPGRNFDHAAEQLFLAMGCSPPSLANVWMHHGIYEAAREQGCDLLLSADLGNQTISNCGDWAPAEYFRRFNWREAWLILRDEPFAQTPPWRRFMVQCLAAQLSDKWWHAWQRLKGRKPQDANAEIAMVRPDAARRFRLAERARQAGVLYDRPVIGTRRQALIDAFARGDNDAADVELGFTQLYGIRCRDVTAYRPLVEFCSALPTRMYVRGGQQRWLARELGRGMMPEAQREDTRWGFHNADWHARTSKDLGRLRREIEAAGDDPVLNDILDVPRALKAVDEWPETSQYDPESYNRFVMGLPRAVLMARFVRFASGRN